MNNKYQALPEHELLTHKSFIRNLNLFDWAFALLIAVGAFIAQTQAGLHMDIYEMVILWVSAGIAVFLGWFFKPMRWFIPLGVCLAYLAVDLYGGDIKRADGFLLKYLLSSQSAIMWQCAFVFFALFAYIVGAIAAVRKNVPSNTLLGMGTVFAWVSAMAGFVGLLVRWHESYLLRPDAGHIPVSNLYEVFILFLVITALMYLYYEGRFAVQKLGGFVFSFMAIVVGSAADSGFAVLVDENPRSGQLYRLRRILYCRHAGYCRTAGTQKRRCRQKIMAAALASH